MSLSLKEVFAKVNAQQDPSMGLIRDGPIFYFVMNKGQNVFNLVTIEKVNRYIDQIEASTGPAVLVTIGTGDMMFSTGFDLKFWAENITNPITSIPKMQALLDRIMTLSIPSFAVMNGHAYAGGLILALCHDFRIMAKGKKRICLSELNIGLPLPPAYTAYCTSTLPIQTFRKLHWGEAYGPEEALKDNVVNDLYDTEVDAEKAIKNFAKRFAPLGQHRASVKNNKQNMFKNCLDITRNQAFAPGPMTLVVEALSKLPKAKPQKAKL